MKSKRARLALPLLAATLLLAGCRSVPDVTQVPVPDGPTVFHGTYIGTLTEALEIIAAAPSADATQLYAAARTSEHTTLLVLDRSTGRELRRVKVPVAEPRDLVTRADGTLVLAGRKASATLDPGTLGVLTRLPGAQRISADGERLLIQRADDRVGRIQTRDGSTVPTTALTLAWGFGVENVSRDLEWVATEDGNAVINLSTGVQIDTASGHLNPCPAPSTSIPRITALAASAEGFVLGRQDNTLEWRNPDGSLRDARWLGPACDLLSAPDWVLALQGTQVGYQRSTGNRDMPGEVAIGRWVPGGEPQVIARTTETTTLPFASTFALGAPEAYLQRIKLPARGLRLGGRWEQAYEPPRFPVTTQVTASYRDEQQYGVQGTLKALDLTYAVVGTGSNSGGAGSIVFTQAICGIPPFAPNCPSTKWEADLFQGGQKVGRLFGNDQDPNRTGPGRAVQEGQLLVSLDGEYRSFGFQLTPSAGPK
ncbi:hypothetical protein [Deinococcus humi]|uniref:Lipoprotein n=1 Tax=Deinococcus humi TaxID=662880 RepID=A0A7W8K0E9_9DEIO|nr:hypothetical protein [Deinococcus humi]MBB5366355.1 hypothetical protein [Deinococcus humi]GGO41426.1 hypothetical protein GCM10008949_52220 [Deinococcus humi]